MILHSPNAEHSPDPLVMAQGGPGGSTIDFFGAVMTGGLGTQFLAQRDIILIEQRGTFYAKPNLVCDEFLTSNLAVLDQTLSVPETDNLNLAAAGACYDRLTAEGINLSAFNSVENAADVPMVISALGYSEYNYYGVSYGTMLAQHLMTPTPPRILP
jgi:pimeloyl-ACP methyl ester carboxylesterase